MKKSFLILAFVASVFVGLLASEIKVNADVKPKCMIYIDDVVYECDYSNKEYCGGFFYNGELTICYGNRLPE